MSATTTASATRGRTARKILGSLGVVGAAAAVAGLGTFGTFTDSTTPLNASVTTGTLDIQLDRAGTTTLPMSAAGFVPGSSISRAVDLRNAGDLPFSGL
ncbi:TasA family protein, partial [Modestobacter roseus]